MTLYYGGFRDYYYHCENYEEILATALADVKGLTTPTEHAQRRLHRARLHKISGLQTRGIADDFIEHQGLHATELE